MNTKLHTCHPYLSPAQLTKQARLDVKTDGEGREKDSRNLGRVQSCFRIPPTPTTISGFSISAIWARSRHAQREPFTDPQEITPKTSWAATSSNLIDKILLIDFFSPGTDPGSPYFQNHLLAGDWLLSDWDPLCVDSVHGVPMAFLLSCLRYIVL